MKLDPAFDKNCIEAAEENDRWGGVATEIVNLLAAKGIALWEVDYILFRASNLAATSPLAPVTT